MSRRVIALVGALALTAVVAVAWLIVPWGADSGRRTDRIIEVYGHQMGLSPDEAEQVRDQALDAAEVICSTEPDELDELVGGHPNSIRAAIDMAEVACPRSAADFKVAHPEGQ